ncbi:alpha/beta hydrolase family protein [Agrilutibacter solisilvae]|uniref:Alpha/beta hydrolase n=1 Tax=Agrilutibacter solisilvae TaxID=2763317 RepID=A0A975ARI5_9GAMM|nr:alpha/beta family hydrolase [Lysobacter solisilvae]QSX77064.1 alpha/beta hydrolase [Lysobacter solisilvae]
MAAAAPFTFQVAPDTRVSARADVPEQPWAVLVLAHGAGAGMDHAFMAAAAQGLCARGIAVLRYQFPYMERGSRRPDPPRLAQATVRAAVAEAGARWPGLPLFAGGKSFGGRMSSQAQAEGGLPGVAGLVFLGFPLHPAGKPGVARAQHLDDVALPMLFVQGTRDELALPDLLVPVVARLATRARLHAVEAADHSFHVPARSGRTDAQVLDEVLDVAADWMRALA